ncbi:MAG: DegT/DnrJ/EryC1/StrS aminotransferase family protein [Candidatus Omnitrophica bacterium]|nr:DegT/DnrJ/EryC1/StrS aminotransferase family protein [Candidatus Omnitrophota bacterium]
MSQKNIPLSQVVFGDEEVKACAEVLRSGNLREGQKTKDFETAFRHQVGTRHAITASSGTAALHLVYQALLQPGDEVIVPAFTFIATASMVSMTGAKPVFVDVDPNTWTIDPVDIEKKLTSRTRMIAGVHLFGNSCDIARIQKIASAHKLKLIWDAAQSLGARYQGRDIAVVPDAVCFSFYPSKNMTTGEGGMITTNDDSLAAKVRYLKSHGETEKYIHAMIGFNYRMTDIEASLGLLGLTQLEDFLARRKNIAVLYEQAFKQIPGIKIQRQTPGSEHSWNYFSIVLDTDKLGISRDEFMKQLQSRGISCAVYYPRPLHLQPCFAQGQVEPLPVSEYLASRILSIPMHPFLSDEDVDTVIRAVAELTKRPASVLY